MYIFISENDLRRSKKPKWNEGFYDIEIIPQSGVGNIYIIVTSFPILHHVIPLKKGIQFALYGLPLSREWRKHERRGMKPWQEKKFR